MIDVAVVRERLTAFHGVNVPAPYAKLVQWLYGSSTERERAFDRRFCAEARAPRDVVVHDAPAPGDSYRMYDNEPIEYVPLFDRGDGTSFGYVALAPEIPAGELPVIGFRPTYHPEQVIQLGDDLFDGLGTAIAFEFETPQDVEDDEGEPNLAEVFGFPVACRQAPSAAAYHPAVVPPGYRFVPSSDRVGTLAPRGAFAGDVARGANDAAADTLGFAERLLEIGAPASAIVLLRELRQHTAWNEPFFGDLLALWERASIALARPYHVARLRLLREATAQWR